MKNFKYSIAILLIFSILFSCKDEDKSSTPAEMLKNITWYNQSAISISWKETKLFIDPYMLKNEDIADVVLITHSHDDHFSVPALKKIVKDKTVIIGPKDIETSIKSNFANNQFIAMLPGESKKIDEFLIEGVPAYNIERNYHPKESKWLGYIVTVDGVKIYHSGDTELIPEMQKIDCDIAFLPMGQTYTFVSVEDAVLAAIDVKAEIAVPFHYGVYEGKEADAVKFKELLEGKIEVVILTKN